LIAGQIASFSAPAGGRKSPVTTLRRMNPSIVNGYVRFFKRPQRSVEFVLVKRCDLG
jgi:hypothetical protein